MMNSHSDLLMHFWLWSLKDIDTVHPFMQIISWSKSSQLQHFQQNFHDKYKLEIKALLPYGTITKGHICRDMKTPQYSALETRDFRDYVWGGEYC